MSYDKLRPGVPRALQTVPGGQGTCMLPSESSSEAPPPLPPKSRSITLDFSGPTPPRSDSQPPPLAPKSSKSRTLHVDIGSSSTPSKQFTPEIITIKKQPLPTPSSGTYEDLPASRSLGKPTPPDIKKSYAQRPLPPIPGSKPLQMQQPVRKQHISPTDPFPKTGELLRAETATDRELEPFKRIQERKAAEAERRAGQYAKPPSGPRPAVPSGPRPAVPLPPRSLPPSLPRSQRSQQGDYSLDSVSLYSSKSGDSKGAYSEHSLSPPKPKPAPKVDTLTSYSGSDPDWDDKIHDSFVRTKTVFSLNASNYNEYIKQKDVTLVLYYDPKIPESCWTRIQVLQAAKTTKRKDHIYTAVNCVEDKALCDKEDVSSLPFLRIYSRGHIVGSFRDFQRFDAKTLKAFVEASPVLEGPIVVKSKCALAKEANG